MANEKGFQQMKMVGTKLTTMALGSVIIGSAKNPDFLMAILTTQIGQFTINNGENPETVDMIGKIREGDVVEIEAFSSFNMRKRNDGSDITDNSCEKFRIVRVTAGEETIAEGLENRVSKKPIIGKGSKKTTGDASSAKEEEVEDKG